MSPAQSPLSQSYMGPIDLLFHLIGFVLPALVVGVLLVFLARIFMPKSPSAPVWWRQATINTGVGVLVLLAGLVVFGRDGKMATYAALVVAMASSQWVLLRGWR